MNDTTTQRSVIGPALILLVLGLLVWAGIMFGLLAINGDDSHVSGTSEDSAPALLHP